MTGSEPPIANTSLDTEDWTALRAQAHRMLDDMLDYVATLRERPVWVPMPDRVRQHFRSEISRHPASLQDVHREFMDFVLPYAGGNVHPRFMGWVQGAGTATGMLAEMLAGGLNANLGGRDQAPIKSNGKWWRGRASYSAFRTMPAEFLSPVPLWPIC